MNQNTKATRDFSAKCISYSQIANAALHLDLPRIMITTAIIVIIQCINSALTVGEFVNYSCGPQSAVHTPLPLLTLRPHPRSRGNAESEGVNYDASRAATWR